MPSPGGRIPVWDAAVRLLHWTLAALVLLNLVRDDGDWWHRVAGYVAVGLVLARWLWAGVRGGSAGFATLKPSPARTLAFLRSGAPRTPDHDPLGVWMIWLLWTLVLLLGLTGWMSRLDAFWGDDRVHDLHAWLADALLVAVAVHLCGIAVMSWHWRENLPGSMLHGRKRAADRPD